MNLPQLHEIGQVAEGVALAGTALFVVSSIRRCCRDFISSQDNSGKIADTNVGQLTPEAEMAVIRAAETFQVHEY